MNTSTELFLKDNRFLMKTILIQPYECEIGRDFYLILYGLVGYLCTSLILACHLLVHTYLSKINFYIADIVETQQIIQQEQKLNQQREYERKLQQQQFIMMPNQYQRQLAKRLTSVSSNNDSPVIDRIQRQRPQFRRTISDASADSVMV
ncbi:unnamed protein product [Didymodactylos carnosus]|nr:unnamed protein product [Didymodactylos carnosus]CAF3652346.1 unnamed protein product [Didymodactylos carnosus]